MQGQKQRKQAWDNSLMWFETSMWCFRPVLSSVLNESYVSFVAPMLNLWSIANSSIILGVPRHMLLPSWEDEGLPVQLM